MKTSKLTPPIEFMLKTLHGEIADKTPNHPLEPGERVLGRIKNEYVPLLLSAMRHLPSNKRNAEGQAQPVTNMPYTFWLFQSMLHLITAQLAFEFPNCLKEGEYLAFRYDSTKHIWVAVASS